MSGKPRAPSPDLQPPSTTVAGLANALDVSSSTLQTALGPSSSRREYPVSLGLAFFLLVLRLEEESYQSTTGRAATQAYRKDTWFH